nr:hypothetical protein [Sphaerochaetaceae bacterium]
GLCLFVSCSDGSGSSSSETSVVGTWKYTGTNEYTDKGDECVLTFTSTAVVNEDYSMTLSTYIDKLLVGGVDKTNTIPSSDRTVTYTGTYTLSSSTTGSFSATTDTGDTDDTTSGTFTLSDGSLVVTIEGTSRTFTKE